MTRMRSSAAALLVSALVTGGIAMAPGSATAADGLTLETFGATVVSEGTPTTRHVFISDPVDEGAAGWDYVVDFDDGTPGVSGHTTDTTLTLVHSFPNGPAEVTVRITVFDSATDTAALAIPMVVANVPPTPTTSGADTTLEGSDYLLNVGATDPGGPFESLLFAIDWADGFSTIPLLPAGVYSHRYADDADGPVNGTIHPITVAHFDSDDGAALLTKLVTVLNVPPVIALGGAASVDRHAPYSLTLGAITDPGRDTVTQREISWGDGTTEIVTAGGTYTHTYATTGPKPISVTLVDEDGTWADAGIKTVVVNAIRPTAPTGLSAQALGRTSILLEWTNTSDDALSIFVERCAGNTCRNFVRVASIQPTDTWVDRGLTPGTPYRYRLRVRNAAGFSPYSTLASARTVR